MAKVCVICGKGSVKGRTASHSQVKTNRRFYPNLQKVRVSHGQNTRQVWMCTKCIKREKKAKISALTQDTSTTSK